MSYKRFDYLDLAIRGTQTSIITLEGNKHICFVNTHTSHTLTGNNSQLNSIIDLLVSLCSLLDNQQNKLEHCFNKLFESLKLIENNFGYLKNFQHLILSKTGTRKNFDFTNFQKDLENNFFFTQSSTQRNKIFT